MATLIDVATNESVEVPDNQVSGALKSGKYGLFEDAKLRVVSPAGKFGYIPAKNAYTAFDKGFRTPTSEEESQEQDRKDFTTPGNQAMAATLGALRGAVPFSDQFIRAGGALLGVPDTMNYVRKLDEHNKGVSTVAEVAGTIGGVLTGAAFTKAASLPGLAARAGAITEGVALRRLGVKAAEKAAAGTLSAEAAKEIGEAGFKIGAKRWLASAAAATVEGAAFGANKLASEQALGRADINGESLMAYVGGSALLGGAVGGLFAAGPMAKYGIGKVADKLRGEITDQASGGIVKGIIEDVSEKASMRAIGITGAASRKLQQSGKLKNAKHALRTATHPDGGKIVVAGRDAEDLVVRLGDTLEHHGQKIGKFIDDIDLAAAKAPKSEFINPQTIAERIESEIVGRHARLGATQKLAAIGEEWASIYAKRGTRMQFRIAQAEKQAVGQSAYKNSKIGQDLNRAGVERDVERIINDELENKLEAAASKYLSPNAFKEYKESKKIYAGLVDITREAKNTVARAQGNRAIGLTDTIAGGTGAIAGMLSGGPVGALAGIATALGNKIARERGQSVIAAIADRASTLGAIQNVTHVVQNNLDRAAVNFVQKAARPRLAPVAAASVLLNSEFGPRPAIAAKKATNIRLAAKQRADELATMVTNPQALTDHIASRLEGMEEHAPEIATELSRIMANTALFLHEKAPKRPNVPQNLITSLRDWEPSDAEAYKFARYVSAASEPMAVMDRLATHTVTPEDAETWDRLMPGRKQLLGQTIINEYNASGKTPSHDDLVALSIFFGTPFVASMDKGFISRQQQVFSQPPPVGAGGGGQRISGIEQLTLGSRSATQAQRLELPV